MSAWLNALIAELEPADRSQGRQHPQARQFASESHRFKTNSSITVCKGWSPVRVPPRAQHSPRQRGFCFNVCTKLVGGVPLTLVRGLCLAAAMAYAGVWGGGQGPGWLDLCLPWGGVMRFLALVLSGWSGWPTPVHSYDSRVQYDVAGFGAELLGGLPAGRSRELQVPCLSCQRGCGQCPHLCLIFVCSRVARSCVFG
jgi:hypothetical protein